MKALALLFGLASGLVTGCSLYFDKDGNDRPLPLPYPIDAGIRVDAPSPYPLPPPPPPLPPGSGEMMARCENGIVRAAPAPAFFELQPHGFGDVVGRCATATCGSAVISCGERMCGEAVRVLCNAPSSPGATCSLHGFECQETGTEPLACPEVTSCSESLPGSSCVCLNGAYHCEQLTPAAAVQARIVGKWTGLVTPPNFALPYRISLWIYPDGSYWPESLEPGKSAFYYGGDGPSPARTIKILSTSDDRGSWADIAIDFGTTEPNTGLLSALVVDDTSLRFTFSPTWLGCGKPFDFELTRVRETR